MTGVFVPVVGPSGAGKDTLIAAARDSLGADSRFLFVRRTVTRAEGGNEDHDTIDAAGFAACRRDGAYVLSWGAHGLYYGIPVSALEATRRGRVVVANLSRGVLTDARAAFPAVRIVNVTAPPAVLASRLAGRGRETRAEIETRLARRSPVAVSGPDVLTVENAGALDEAVERLTHLLLRLAETIAAPQ
ncbi:MAG TPA: phosphonate metabolism protein/1,5-bisphosphokinase (PRPP-forming) PhnN [Methylomirabilota bacterium]|nr:phosphonate metabolism protein/1,5-bisphosphokinase (PRPP-forming) PhnN [Methylomirabilota bacterium]